MISNYLLGARKLVHTPYSKMAAILVLFAYLQNLPLLLRLKENILLNFEFTNEATRTNLQVNKSTLNGRPFWNKVYRITELSSTETVYMVRH